MHQDPEYPETYDAFEKDIAVVNFYFGKPTTMGRTDIALFYLQGILVTNEFSSSS